MNDGRSRDNLNHMYATVQQLRQLLEHLVEIARAEFDHPSLGGYDPRMVDAFSQAIMRTGQGLDAARVMIDQDFIPITQEDVIAALRHRRGLPERVQPQPDTRGKVPLSELPPWDTEAFDPGSPEQRRQQHHGKNRSSHEGRHRLPEGIDMSVSPEERGETT